MAFNFNNNMMMWGGALSNIRSMQNQNNIIYQNSINNLSRQQLINSRIQPPVDGSTIHRYPIDDVGHFEGECWYNPATLEMKRITMGQDGKWIAVSEEEYNRCYRGHSPASSSCMVGGYSTAVGQQSYAYGCQGSNPYESAYGVDSHDRWTGHTHTENEKFQGATYRPEKIIDISHMEDIEVYKKHLYREELKRRGLKNIGLNKFGLLPNINRDDSEICDLIENKMKNPINRDMTLDGTGGELDTPQTRFERRIYSALKRKEELDKKKKLLLKKMGQKQAEAKENFNEKLAQFKEKRKTSGYDNFIKGLQEEKFSGLKEPQYFEQVSQDMKNPPKPPTPTKRVTTDKQYLDLYVATKFGWTTKYVIDEEVDDLKFINITFNPSIDEEHPCLDIFVELKGKILKYEERFKDEMVEDLINSNSTPDKFIGSVLSVFKGKKMSCVKEVRVKYDDFLKKAKSN